MLSAAAFWLNGWDVPLEVQADDTTGLRDGTVSRHLETNRASLLTTSSTLGPVTVRPSRTDTTGLTDSTSIMPTHAETDPAGLADTLTRTVGRAVPTDTAGLSDALTFTIRAIVNDRAGTLDWTEPAVGWATSPTSSTGSSDEPARHLGTVHANTLGLADDQIIFKRPTLGVSSGLSTTDTTLTVLGRTFDSTTSSSDTASTVTVYQRQQTDGLAPRPALTGQPGTLGPLAPGAVAGSARSDSTIITPEVARTDTNNLDDLATRVVVYERTITEQASAGSPLLLGGVTGQTEPLQPGSVPATAVSTDTTDLAVHRTVTDLLASSDVHGLVRQATAADTAGLTDTASTHRTVGYATTTLTGLTDSLAFTSSTYRTHTSGSGSSDQPVLAHAASRTHSDDTHPAPTRAGFGGQPGQPGPMQAGTTLTPTVGASTDTAHLSVGRGYATTTLTGLTDTVRLGIITPGQVRPHARAGGSRPTTRAAAGHGRTVSRPLRPSSGPPGELAPATRTVPLST